MADREQTRREPPTFWHHFPGSHPQTTALGFVVRKSDYDALLAELEQAKRELKRWLEWSGGQYPDDSPGDVVSAYLDGSITLDDGVTTWNPIRALAWAKEQTKQAERERDEAREEAVTLNWRLAKVPALVGYARHDTLCDHNVGLKCDCGLSELLATWEQE